jgi:peptidyl-prolyl cis-trans isomerase NIMA-interacting 1
MTARFVDVTIKTIFKHKSSKVKKKKKKSKKMSSLPAGWSQKESKSHPGRFFYINNSTGETTWDRPTAAADAGQQVRVFHILRKHRGSRRPSSWRQETITQSIEEATEQINSIITDIRQAEATGGFDALFQRFQEIAQTESDCGSHERGGDLGFFGRGQMQKAFEDVSFALSAGEMSDPVETDSGVHVLLRIK